MINRRNTKAALVNSMTKAESLSPDEQMMNRFVEGEPLAREIIASWSPSLSLADRIVTIP